jgi:hypothetical protein
MEGFVGDDGQRYKNPCTSSRGVLKERWPNEQAAWFVADLVARGIHRAKGVPAKMYPYHCPKCHGYHLSSCRTKKHFDTHEAGIAALRDQRTLQSPQKKGH